MKLKNKFNQDDKITDSNLLPLVNIIFLLLIFFLLAGVIEKKRDLLNINLPEATIEEFTGKDRPELHIYPNGKIRLDGSDVTLKNLSDSLKKRYPQLKDSELLVTADADITSKHLNEILLILDRTKVKKISLLTLKNE
tara:strand:+ start:3928 stop:4341 length:414 start_codon:yes stop_codon:yes gene_type:complete